MPFFVGDYLADTGHLSTEQHGAYILLILHYWRQGCLVDDDRQLANIAKLSLFKWKGHAEIIRGFFKSVDGFLKNKRIEEELAKAAGKKIKAKQNGGLGGNPNFKKGKSNPYYDNQKVMLKDNHSDISGDKQKISSSPSHSPLEEELLPALPVKHTLKELAPIYEGCEFFRIRDHEKALVQAHFKKEGWPLDKVVIMIKLIDNWLAKDTPNALKARKSDTHFRRLYDITWLNQAIEAKNIVKKANGPTNIGEAMKDQLGFLPGFQERAKMQKQSSIEILRQEALKKDEMAKNIIKIGAK